MKDEKYVFLIDVDNTLVLKGESEIEADIVEEIERLKKQGHIFVVATGRSLYSVINIKGVECFQYLSVLLGSCEYEMPGKKLLYEAESMPVEEVKRFVKYLESKNIEWSYKDEMYEKTIFPNSKFYKNNKHYKLASIEEYNYDLARNKITQLLVIANLSKEEFADFPDFEFCPMPGNYMDVSMKNYAKDRSVEFFKNKYPQMTTVAIGDSSNDLSMFKKADISIAMGNAGEDVKSCATFVTKGVTEGGLIYAFRNILKI